MELLEKKTQKEINERKVLFKTYLIQHDTTQKAIAAELGISMTSILRSIERGAFEWGPFAEWWKKNIEYHSQNTSKTNSTIKEPPIELTVEEKSLITSPKTSPSSSNLEPRERLKTLRKILNLNQDKFSKKLRIAQTSYSSIEQGKRNLSSTILISLDNLGINIHWLLTGNGEMFNSSSFFKNLDGEITKAIDILLELPEDKKQECINYINDKKMLFDLQAKAKQCTID